ncbi:cytochrome c oxidase assembly protein [Termitidicoccus mucosus]
MIDWRHWHNEPHLVGGLILLGWLYAVLTGPLRPRIAPADTPSYPKKNALWFYSALLVFYLAVGSPLDQVGERFLLSAHMVQHQLLIYVAAPLFLAGIPPWLAQPVTARPALRPLLRVILHPVVCGIVFVLTLSLWHAPFFYEAALQNKTVHIIEHVMFFGAALFYWRPVLSPSPEFPPLRPGLRILYLVAVTIAMTPVFAFIAFSGDVLYPTYEYAPRLFALLSPKEDQLLAAGIMKLGDMAVVVLLSGVAFWRWCREAA